MSDVAQILGIAAPGSAAAGASSIASELDKLKPAGASPASAAAAAAMRVKNSKQKKLSGMQREVLELLESTHRVNHALYPGVSKLSLQQKWKQHKAPAVKWCVCSSRGLVALERMCSAHHRRTCVVCQ